MYNIYCEMPFFDRLVLPSFPILRDTQNIIPQTNQISLINYYNIKMCQAPCATCFAQNFYSCSTCEGSLTKIGSLCLQSPYMIGQIATTFVLIIFILPVFIRKRSVVLIKILDFIQIASYFKFINGYTAFRHNWLYLGMRSWGSWSQGWNLIDGDEFVPVFTNEQGHIDKVIRLVGIWILMLIIIMVIGIFKVALTEAPPSYWNFIKKNVTQYVWFAFYITLLDMAFIVANIPNLTNFRNFYQIISFGIAILLAIVILGFTYWGFYIINFVPDDYKYHQYQHMFLLCYDYDLYPAYELTRLPSSPKKIHKFSNLRLLGVVMKVAYAFFIVGFLNLNEYKIGYMDEVYQIMAFILFFQLVWLIFLPMDISTQFVQFFILISAQIWLFVMLICPWFINVDLVLLTIAVVPYFLAIISIFLQIFLSVYKLIPIDMYQTGLKVVIDDPQLRAQLAQRKRIQAQQQQRLKELQRQRSEMLKKILQNSYPKQREQQQFEKKQSIKSSHYPIDKTEQNHQEQQMRGNSSDSNNEIDDVNSMNTDQVAQFYKIDEMRRRKIYQWQKNGNFYFSNKMGLNDENL